MYIEQLALHVNRHRMTKIVAFQNSARRQDADITFSMFPYECIQHALTIAYADITLLQHPKEVKPKSECHFNIIVYNDKARMTPDVICESRASVFGRITN